MNYFSVPAVKVWALVLGTIGGAFALLLVELPGWLRWFYPQWVAVVVLTWTLLMPYRINVGTAWSCGLILDIFSYMPLGVNALGLTLAVWILVGLVPRLEELGLMAKTFLMFLLLVGVQLLPLGIELYLGRAHNFGAVFTRAFSSTLVWLGIFVWVQRTRGFNFANYY